MKGFPDPVYGNKTKAQLRYDKASLQNELDTYSEPLHPNYNKSMGKEFTKNHLNRVNKELSKKE